MIYPNNFEDIVGFSPLREDIKRFCRLESAQAKAIEFGFVRDELELFKRLDEIDECNLLNEQLPSLFEWGKVVDIDESLKHVSVDGYFLMETEWVSVLTVLKSYQRFAQALTNRQGDFPRWAVLFGPSEAARGCQALIVKVIDEEGNIHNNASSEYQKISLEISRMEREARNATKSIFKEWKALGYTADTDVTIREERLVIPVLAEFKRKVKGFVKDVSATGKVLFIEPASLLEVNNRLRELFADRKRERERLLKQLTRDIAPFTPQLLQLTANLSTADFIYAKWQMLQLIQAERPRFKKDGGIYLKSVVHPVLKRELGKQNKKIIPLDIELQDQRIVVVSGPNAGGKSVVLKTVLLTQYMFQCGLFVSAKPESEMGIFEQLMIDCGDGQSIEAGLSTFSAHLANLKAIMDHGSDRSLIGLDELGTGTDPRYGAPIAQSVLERLAEKKSFVIATTHFSQIREWGARNPKVMQASMAYDAVKLEPRYQFVSGKPGSSFALELMRKTGFDTEWLESIQELAGQQLGKTEDLMLDLDRKNEHLQQLLQDNQRKNAHLQQLIDDYSQVKDKIQSKRQQIIDQTRLESQKILSKANQQIEETIRIIRENRADKNKTQKARQELDGFKKTVDDKLKPLAGLDKSLVGKSVEEKTSPENTGKEKPVSVKIMAGSKVKNTINGQKGEVIEIKKDKVLVVFGLIKMWVPMSELQAVGGTESVQKKQGTGFQWIERQSTFSANLDIRGLRGEESILKIQKWLDEGYALGSRDLKVIHGRGDGILRKLIRDYLKTVNFVKSYKYETEQQGGDGATLITLN